MMNETFTKTFAIFGKVRYKCVQLAIRTSVQTTTREKYNEKKNHQSMSTLYTYMIFTQPTCVFE